MKKFRSTSVFILISIIFPLFFATQSQAGLFGPSADTKKNIAAIKALGKTESKLIARYTAVTGTNSKDDYTTGMALINLLPDVNTFIGKIEALSPNDTKLANAVRLWDQAWNKQAEGMTLFISAIDAQDYAKAAQANSALASGRVIFKKAQAALLPFLK
jgi:hypothetical protein